MIKPYISFCLYTSNLVIPFISYWLIVHSPVWIIMIGLFQISLFLLFILLRRKK